MSTRGLPRAKTRRTETGGGMVCGRLQEGYVGQAAMSGFTTAYAQAPGKGSSCNFKAATV